jgi:hypothetical protein
VRGLRADKCILKDVSEATRVVGEKHLINTHVLLIPVQLCRFYFAHSAITFFLLPLSLVLFRAQTRRNGCSLFGRFNRKRLKNFSWCVYIIDKFSSPV